MTLYTSIVPFKQNARAQIGTIIPLLMGGIKWAFDITSPH